MFMDVLCPRCRYLGFSHNPYDQAKYRHLGQGYIYTVGVAHDYTRMASQTILIEAGPSPVDIVMLAIVSLIT